MSLLSTLLKKLHFELYRYSILATFSINCVLSGIKFLKPVCSNAMHGSTKMSGIEFCLLCSVFASLERKIASNFLSFTKYALISNF